MPASSAGVSKLALSTTRPVRSGRPAAGAAAGAGAAAARLAAEGALAWPQPASPSATASRNTDVFTPPAALLAVAEIDPWRLLRRLIGPVRHHRLAAVDDPRTDHRREGA